MKKEIKPIVRGGNSKGKTGAGAISLALITCWKQSGCPTSHWKNGKSQTGKRIFIGTAYKKRGGGEKVVANTRNQPVRKKEPEEYHSLPKSVGTSAIVAAIADTELGGGKKDQHP